MCSFCAEGEVDGPDEELEKLFTNVLPDCRASLSYRAKSFTDIHAIRNCAQRFAQVAARPHRKAKRDAHTAATEVHPLLEEIEQGNAPEALEIQMTHEERETTASTSPHGRGRERGDAARGRSRRRRS